MPAPAVDDPVAGALPHALEQVVQQRVVERPRHHADRRERAARARAPLISQHPKCAGEEEDAAARPRTPGARGRRPRTPRARASASGVSVLNFSSSNSIAPEVPEDAPRDARGTRRRERAGNAARQVVERHAAVRRVEQVEQRAQHLAGGATRRRHGSSRMQKRHGGHERVFEAMITIECGRKPATSAAVRCTLTIVTPSHERDGPQPRAELGAGSMLTCKRHPRDGERQRARAAAAAPGPSRSSPPSPRAARRASRRRCGATSRGGEPVMVAERRCCARHASSPRPPGREEPPAASRRRPRPARACPAAGDTTPPGRLHQPRPSERPGAAGTPLHAQRGCAIAAACASSASARRSARGADRSASSGSRSRPAGSVTGRSRSSCPTRTRSRSRSQREVLEPVVEQVHRAAESPLGEQAGQVAVGRHEHGHAGQRPRQHQRLVARAVDVGQHPVAVAHDRRRRPRASRARSRGSGSRGARPRPAAAARGAPRRRRLAAAADGDVADADRPAARRRRRTRRAPRHTTAARRATAA